MKLNTWWMMVLVVLAVTGCAGQDATQVKPDSENPLSVASSIVEVEVVSQAENLPDGTARSNNEYKSDPSLTTNAEPSVSAISLSMVPENDASSDIVEQVSEEGLTESLNEPGQVEDTEGTIDNGVGSSSDTVDSPPEQNEPRPFQILAQGVRDCVVRGLVRNTSDTHGVHNLEVVAASQDSFGRLVSSTYRWPLTLLPGEEVPFEMSPWYGTLDANEIHFSVRGLLTEAHSSTRPFAMSYPRVEPPDMLAYGIELMNNSSFWHSYYYLLSLFPVELPALLDYFPEGTLPEEDIASNLFLFRSGNIQVLEEEIWPAYEVDGRDRGFSDLVVYQAIVEGREYPLATQSLNSRVVEVRELSPFYWSTEEQEFLPLETSSEGEHRLEEMDIRFVETIPLVPLGLEYEEYHEGKRDGVNDRFPYFSRLWVGQAGNDLKVVGTERVVSQYIPPTELDAEWEWSLDRKTYRYRPSCGNIGPLYHDNTVDSWQHYNQNYGFPQYPMGYVKGSGRPLDTSDGRRDEVLQVVEGSITIREGVIRGLVLNVSKDQYARDVRVLASTSDTPQVAWWWPLTVQPGEHVPFEIEDWKGTNDLSQIDFDVDSTLSQDVDISRAFKDWYFTGGLSIGGGAGKIRGDALDYRDYMDTIGWNRVVAPETLQAYYPEWLLPNDLGDGKPYQFSDVYFTLAPTSSHMRLNDDIESQDIENASAFIAYYDDSIRVRDVLELQPFTEIAIGSSGGNQMIAVSSLPTLDNVSPRSFRVLIWRPAHEVDGEYRSLDEFQDYDLWVGGSNLPEE
ncbi:hypothetical protein [Candidatus Poriferisocius sp.]|uniref:hypothetical protein n=1 Tax=Candidatus Poriferisocius sp. TaxID=3101276 RepID=UPI003B5CC26C